MRVSAKKNRQRRNAKDGKERRQGSLRKAHGGEAFEGAFELDAAGCFEEDEVAGAEFPGEPFAGLFGGMEEEAAEVLREATHAENDINA